MVPQTECGEDRHELAEGRGTLVAKSKSSIGVPTKYTGVN
jgi:hypothetical protein